MKNIIVPLCLSVIGLGFNTNYVFSMEENNTKDESSTAIEILNKIPLSVPALQRIKLSEKDLQRLQSLEVIKKSGESDFRAPFLKDGEINIKAIPTDANFLTECFEYKGCQANLFFILAEIGSYEIFYAFNKYVFDWFEKNNISTEDQKKVAKYIANIKDCRDIPLIFLIAVRANTNNGFASCLKAMSLEWGSDLRARCDKMGGETALGAIMNYYENGKNIDIPRLLRNVDNLLKAKADPNAVCHRSIRPLSFIANALIKRGDAETTGKLLRLFIDAKVDLNIPCTVYDKQGRRILYYIIEAWGIGKITVEKCIELVNMLVRAGADKKKCGDINYTGNKSLDGRLKQVIAAMGIKYKKSQEESMQLILGTDAIRD